MLRLNPFRLNLLRFGYLFMGLGLATVKWPLLPRAHTLPLYESVTLCLLTAMSLLALLGLRYPIQLLPVLVLEVLWKVLWLGLVALPRAVTGTLDPATQDVIVNCAFIVVIIPTIPWSALLRPYRRPAPERTGRV
ncbi:hypothetical protein [Kribbella sp. NPDC048915]|uniref:hypothetical protein n=1 Tax=Kribbella sp. NPDC048915 TaxID=3155148 RepID=UPI0033F61316